MNADCSGEEEAGTVERSIVSWGEFVGEEDCCEYSATGKIGAVAVSSGICTTGLRMVNGGGNPCAHEETRANLLPRENCTAHSSCKLLKSETR